MIRTGRPFNGTVPGAKSVVIQSFHAAEQTAQPAAGCAADTLLVGVSHPGEMPARMRTVRPCAVKVVAELSLRSQSACITVSPNCAATEGKTETHVTKWCCIWLRALY